MARRRRLRAAPAALLALLLALVLAPELPTAPLTAAWSSAKAPQARSSHADRQRHGDLIAAGTPSAALVGIAQHPPRVSGTRSHSSLPGVAQAAAILPRGGWRAWPVAPRSASRSGLLARDGWRSRAPPRAAARSI